MSSKNFFKLSYPLTKIKFFFFSYTFDHRLIWSFPIFINGPPSWHRVKLMEKTTFFIYFSVHIPKAAGCA